jgi:hypothetical protein
MMWLHALTPADTEEAPLSGPDPVALHPSSGNPGRIEPPRRRSPVVAAASARRGPACVIWARVRRAPSACRRTGSPCGAGSRRRRDPRGRARGRCRL